MANEKTEAEAVGTVAAAEVAAGAADIAVNGETGYFAMLLVTLKGLAAANDARKAAGWLSGMERTSAAALAKAVEDETDEFVGNVALGWTRHEERWRAKPPGEQPKATDVAALLVEGRRVYARTMDPDKRRLLHHAMVNAFDPEQYKAGMTRRLLGILDELEYGDVVLLRTIHKTFGTGHETDVASMKCWPGSDRHHHLSVLVREGLVLAVGKRVENTETLQDNNKIRVSALGERLVNLLRDPNVAQY